MNIITLAHGTGGKCTHELIDGIFYKYFNNDVLLQQGDSSIIQGLDGRIAVTTDSYVIDPIFFSDGDIGKLSICGTVNDLAVSGAVPLYITAGFIIEEGLNICELERVVMSMAETAKCCGVKVIAGDTKVVENGKGDKLYINTTGIGVMKDDDIDLSGDSIDEGDCIIVSGTMGDHGTSIFCKRKELDFHVDIKSDCNPLNMLVEDILKVTHNVKFMRDVTRGGLATTLNEAVAGRKKSIIINEASVPIREEVKMVCEILGVDPLYIANEGKIVLIAPKEHKDKIVQVMRNNPLGKDAEIIGEVIKDVKEKVYLKTVYSGTRILNMIEEEMIPRIC